MVTRDTRDYLLVGQLQKPLAPGPGAHHIGKGTKKAGLMDSERAPGIHHEVKSEPRGHRNVP